MASTVSRRTLKGIVVSDSMDKTVVVLVERQLSHKVYKKQIKRSARYKAHDADNSANAGDTVIIRECRPLSKDKRWTLKEIVERAV